MCHDDLKAQVVLDFSVAYSSLACDFSQDETAFVHIFLGKALLVMGKCLSYYNAVFLQ